MTKAKIGLGSLKIPLKGWKYYLVYGGPYRDIPFNMYGVKMAEEIHTPCMVDIPTRDFQTPNVKTLSKGLEKAVTLLLEGKPLYIGCMGGKGRTGLFLAVLAKAFGVKDPVAYVRANYYHHAVETQDQKLFVENFVPSNLVVAAIERARRRSWIKFWKTNLTQPQKMWQDTSSFLPAERRIDNFFLEKN